MLDPVEFGKAMASIVREVTDPLEARIRELESRHPEKGEPGKEGERGERGLDAEPVDISAVAAETLASDALNTLLDGSVARYLEANPPKHGEPGAKGDDGKDAEPIDVSEVVRELIHTDDIKTITDIQVADAVRRYFEANPVRHGNDGKDGVKGDKGDSIKGDPGENGIGLAGAIIDRDGDLVVTTTKGDAIKLGKVVGKDGEHGRAGTDFEGATIDWDGDRNLVIQPKDGVAVTRRVSIPLDRGYWRDGMACEKADILTHNGNAWIALRDTKAKPCTENADDWRLFARRGRDGVDGKNGRDLGPAPPVKLEKVDA